MDREDRLVMIVRTTSPRFPQHGTDNEGLLRNNNTATFGININTMDQEWRQQQFQRQRMQLLSMAIFLCFMVLFFDNRAHDPRNARNRSENGLIRSSNGIYNQTERIQQVKLVENILHQQPGYDALRVPINGSGIYSGTWGPLDTKDEAIIFPQGDLIPYLKIDRDITQQQYVHPRHQGHAWLLLKMKSPSTKEINEDVSYVKGQFVLYEQSSSFAATILPIQGVFLRRLGKLTLFSNSPDSTVQLLYRKPGTERNQSAETTIDPIKERSHLTHYGGLPVVDDLEDYDAIDISPPRNSYSSRFRSGDSFSDQCVSIINLNLEVNESTTFDHTSNKLPHGTRLHGTLSSTNCGLYLSIETTFQEENLNVFFSKASHYAILMTFISMAEIYFLLRQLQTTNTQATASKVSLLTIGHQAILDSYLCLGHLTVGIVAQNVFTAFASVAFVKLIIFSVFEMRYLLIIWKARRPQGFTEGWLILRRELTTLYSRFYLSLLVGLAVFYNFSSQLPFLIFLSYSFWIPQIAHNVHREVKNPFDTGYLYGITILRMFLPLYFYGCPNNFLTAFPMYESKVNSAFCLLLIIWMGLQVAVLVLQQKYGPRFFVPARFLPVKYNYERRMNAQELSLLRTSTNDDDTIDCVICMVELDVKARDYMIAPCDHIFHRECLQGWMQVKMECPTCRCVLPEP